MRRSVERLGYVQRLAHERVHLEDDDRVLLDGERVQGGVVEELLAVRRGGFSPRNVGANRIVVRSRAAGKALVRRLATRCAPRLVEEAVHAGDAGRHDARLGDAEGLGVERHVVVGADDGVGVVLVDARVGARAAGLAHPAVPDGLERARGVPQLDDPRPPVADPVDDRLVVVDQDHVGPCQQPRQAEPVAHRATVGDARLEDAQELVVAVQAAVHHPVVDLLEVAAELGPRVGAEEDAPPVAPGDQPGEAVQDLEAGSPQAADDPVADAEQRPGIGRQRLGVGIDDRRAELHGRG